MDNKSWQDYRKVLVNQQISSKAVEWYLRWAEAFDKALPHVPLHRRTREDVQAYLDSLVRRNKFQDWKIGQAHVLRCASNGIKIEFLLHIPRHSFYNFKI